MPKRIKPTVTFHLDKSNRTKKGKAPIKANVSINSENITKIVDHVFPSDWNTIKQRVKPPRQGAKYNNYLEINETLDLLQNDFQTFANSCIRERQVITKDVVRQFFKGKRSATEKSFWTAYEEYIYMLQVEPKTKQNYELYKTKLEEFKKDTGYYIDYHTINSVFFEKYQYYILSEKGLGWNTFATAIKKLKFFLNWSIKMKYHSETAFKSFSATEKHGTIIFLTVKELSTLYNYNFDSKRLNQVRDRFCFGCYTGLAYSDLKSLSTDHINNGTITKLRNKTKIPLNIPLPAQAIEILERYAGSYKALPGISHQRFNEYIKECCRIAEINTRTLYRTFPKGVETENFAPKHELIGSHIARKTFITILYHSTKDVILTAKIAGCSPEIIRKHYVGTDLEMEKQAIKKAFDNTFIPDPILN